ncbi:hypothetical protein AB0K74_45855, partial [Streptomyces sp. NPDC056159]
YRLTALVGALAVGAQALIATVQTGFDENHVAQLIGLAFLSVFAVFVRFLRDRGREELAQVRSVAEAAQRALLRPLPDRLGTLHIASSYLPPPRRPGSAGVVMMLPFLFAALWGRGDSATRACAGMVAQPNEAHGAAQAVVAYEASN